MPTSRTANTSETNASARNSRASATARTEIINLLKEDHRRVKKALRETEKMDPNEESEEYKSVVTTTCNELRIHTALEEELVYPAAREVLNDEDLIDEAEVEHMTAKILIEKLSDMDSDDDKYVATFRVLGEYVKHHIREEETEIFPRLQRARLDWPSLQQNMESRREALMAEHMPKQEENKRTPGEAPSAEKPSSGKNDIGDKAARRREEEAAEEQDSLPEG